MDPLLDTAQLAKHSRALYAYALHQVRDPAAADDLVQETLMAALDASSERFAGRSSVRTWLVGILKHKIADAFRSRAREPVSYDALGESAEDWLSADDEAAASGMGWLDSLAGDADPLAAAEHRRFVEACERQLGRLPPKAARAFVLAEVLGHDTDEVCAMLGMSSASLWTTVHRTRAMLRARLEAVRP